MGSPLSPMIANVFMEEFELKALKTVKHPPKFWGRYGDNGVNNKKIHVQALFDHINEQHDSIIFMIVEEGAAGTLPILDVRMISEGKNITTDVYRKETHMDHYLQLSSHHLAS